MQLWTCEALAPSYSSNISLGDLRPSGTMSTTEVPSTLPGNVSLADHDPVMFDLIEKEKVREAGRRNIMLEEKVVVLSHGCCVAHNNTGAA